MASRKPHHPDGSVVAYLRVSTVEQAESGLGLAAQRAAIEAYAERAGLRVAHWCTDKGVNGGTAPEKRRALNEALAILGHCTGGLLLVAKLDRLARKASDLLQLREQAGKQGWTFSAADGSVDMTTPHGRMMFTVLGAVAELERDLISARTREALAERNAARKRERDAGREPDGKDSGRPSGLPDEVVQRIVAERAAGHSLPVIAAGLEADGVATSRGGTRWYPSAVRAVLAGARAQRMEVAA